MSDSTFTFAQLNGVVVKPDGTKVIDVVDAVKGKGISEYDMLFERCELQFGKRLKRKSLVRNKIWRYIQLKPFLILHLQR